MRDVGRIDKFLSELGKVWKEKYPDWRFGQLMSNCLGAMYNKHGDFFFYEEDDFLKYFKEWSNDIQ